MKKYRVSVYEEIGGFGIVEANSVEEAKRMAQSMIDDFGVSALPEFDQTHRNTTIQEVEEWE